MAEVLRDSNGGAYWWNTCRIPWRIAEDGDALKFADSDDAVSAGRGQVVSATGQRGRDPQQLARRIGENLDVHAVPAVLDRVVGPAVADAVAFGKGPVQQDELRIVLAQRLEQAGGSFGEGPVQ